MIVSLHVEMSTVSSLSSVGCRPRKYNILNDTTCIRNGSGPLIAMMSVSQGYIVHVDRCCWEGRNVISQ